VRATHTGAPERQGALGPRKPPVNADLTVIFLKILNCAKKHLNTKSSTTFAKADIWFGDWFGLEHVTKISICTAQITIHLAFD
jgi:hypothetical protein